VGVHLPEGVKKQPFKAEFVDANPDYGREFMSLPMVEDDPRTTFGTWITTHHTQRNGPGESALAGPQRFLVRLKRGARDFNPAGEDAGRIVVRHLATQRLCRLYYDESIQTTATGRGGGQGLLNARNAELLSETVSLESALLSI
jgi:hypothetical protein